MRSARLLLAAFALVAAAASTAHAGRWMVGFNFGFPCYPRPYYYGPPVVYAPPPVVYAPAPVVYAQQPVVAAAPAAAVCNATPQAAPAALEQPEPVVRAARQVSSGGGDMEALNDPNPQSRADAIIRLGRARDQRAVRPLIRSLQEDASPQVREAAARALGLIGSPEALEALQNSAGRDPERDVRKTASFAADVIRASLRR